MNRALKSLYVFVLMLTCLVGQNVHAQEHTVGMSGGLTSAVEIQIKGLGTFIDKATDQLQTILNCGLTEEFWNGTACVDTPETDPTVGAQGKEVISVTCSGSNEVAQWNPLTSVWECKGLAISVDCIGEVALSECNTASMSLADGAMAPQTCFGKYGECTADVTCTNGNYVVSNEFCPPIPQNCFASVGGAGCYTDYSLSHAQSGDWACDAGYNNNCTAVCNNGSLTATQNNCVGAGTWVAGSWGGCSATCGGGTQTRSYTCQGGVCTTSQPSNDSQSCNTQACGTWVAGSWGGCSATCGGGTQTRSYTCQGGTCITPQPSNDSQTCNTSACATSGPWSVGSWSSCSVTCGGGTQTRSVSCGYTTCTGGTPSSSQTCNTGACATSGPWSVGSWSSCSVTCGGGTQTRSVSCGYTTCTGGTPSSSQTCNTGSCAVNCAGTWSVGACTHSVACWGQAAAGVCHGGCGSCNCTRKYHTFVVTTPASGGGTACPANYYSACTAPTCSCFTRETFILMADGALKPIDEVKKGEKVQAPGGILNTVIDTRVAPYTGVQYSINGSELFVTGGHPFKTKDGWKAFEAEVAHNLNPTLNITQLEVGDILLTDAGEVELVEIGSGEVTSGTVYNLHLSGTQEYYADGFVVHNK